MRADGSGAWSRTLTLPAGTFSYKAALNGGWAESYGARATLHGADIPLTVPTGGRSVTFAYDPATHWVMDDVNGELVTAAGDFQSELGCTSDWAPDCLRSWLKDTDGDGTYTFRTSAIPAGTWSVKAALGQSWAESYGRDGTRGGANIGFTVPRTGAPTTFTYVAATRVLSVRTQTPPPTTALDTLGAIYTPASTTFRIWSPDSSVVAVTVAGRSQALKPVALAGYTGIYQAVVTGDLHGQPYQFSVNGRAVRDPYAQMVKPGTTQGVVVNDAAVLPTGGAWVPTPALVEREDAVIYEMHIRDFTIDASSGVDPAKRGKFLGLVQTGTTHKGVKTGIDHLKELGVTHVHLLPVFDFNSQQYNWGYDPANYNVPEEQYSQFTAPEQRIREFKDMVNGLHAAGIRVIMDVVYNHTYSKDVLQGITPTYYTANDLSGTGNSLDDGHPMVSRMIQDSLEHWVRNYNIDGFRFDLMGVHHTRNVATWGKHLNATYPDRDLLLYGEPWSGGMADPLEAQKVRYGSVPALAEARIGVFNGTFRDAIKGDRRNATMGYMAGTGNTSLISLGMRGSPLQTKSTNVLPNPWSTAFTHDPEQTINYVSAHDDLNLWDKILHSGASGGAAGRAGQIDKFASGIVLTSQGIPFITEGDEFLRSKVVNGNYAAAENSYNQPDTVNALHWDDKITNAAVFAYYRDVIALRKRTPSLRLTTWDRIHNQTSTQVHGNVVVTAISPDSNAPTDYDTVIIYNPTTTTFTPTLPPGTWTKALDSTGTVSTTSTDAHPLTVTVFTRH